MSVVTYFVETSQGYLDTAAETQFGSVAATVGTLLVLGTTLVVILVFLNMIYQYKAMDGRTAFWLAVKHSFESSTGSAFADLDLSAPPAARQQHSLGINMRIGVIDGGRSVSAHQNHC